MGKYLLKRMISSVLTLLVILTVVFVLLRQMPIEGYFDNFDKLDNSMIAARLTQLGLDQPLHKQLLSFFGGLLHGDLGTSSRYSVGAPISGIIAQKAPISIILGLLSMGVALVLFFGRIRLTGQISELVITLNKMSTVVCMLILGMRLALVPIRPMFTSGIQYVAIALKLFAFPLAALAICSLLPVEREFAMGIYIICCAPTGNMVLSFAELLGEGQDTAANVVLLSTLLSMLTIPLMLLRRMRRGMTQEELADRMGVHQFRAARL